MSNTNIKLKDCWTTDEGYRELYQADEEVVETLDLLDLGDATTLLDNGCGNGELAVQAARKFPDLQVVGYDALESAIVEARKRASKWECSSLSFDQAWADNLPLPSDSVDRALFRNVLHHIAKPEAVIAELARCLKTGGLLLLQAPYNNREDTFSEFLTEFHLLMDDSHRRFYHTVESIQNELTRCGFSSAKISSRTYPFPFVTEPMKNLVVERGFADRLQLNQISENTWTVTLYWVRLTAFKSEE